MSPVEINIKTAAIATISVIFVVYIWYSFSPRENSTPSNRQTSNVLKYSVSWKSSQFTDIPSSVIDIAKDVTIQEGYKSLEINSKNVKVFFREASPPNNVKAKYTVLFLHGAKFTSATWVKEVKSQTHPHVNTLSLVAAAGYRVLAIDLPGWGKSHDSKIPESEQPGFLGHFLANEGIERPVVISPSMSGTYGVPHVMGKDPSTCIERVRGFVPVAPGKTELYNAAQYHRCEAPTMIVYGTLDKAIGLTSLNNLRNLANSEIFRMKDAKHPCYLDNPDEWHGYLYNFLLALDKYE